MTRRPLQAALAVLALAMPVQLQADDIPVETGLVDAMNTVFGKHEGFRANHAKGIVVEGSFTAAPDVAKLSKAALFSGEAIPVTVRFSDATGIPDVPDGSPLAIPQGMAIKFTLPDGSETDMVLNALKFFPVSTGDEFLALLTAIADIYGVTADPAAPQIEVIAREGDSLMVLGMEGRLGQVLRNLVSNAISFSPPYGMISIIARRHQGRILITVEDEGPGVPPDKLDELCRPFVSFADPEMVDAKQSIGLGLSISRALAEAMDGEIRFDNRPDRGFKVEITLPAAAK